MIISKILRKNLFIFAVLFFLTFAYELYASPGVLVVSGNYVSSTSSDLYMELAGTSNVSPVKYDRLVVQKKYTIRGTLTVVLLDGFQPQEGQSFDLIDCATQTGTFQSISLPTLGPGLYWVTANLYVNGTISVEHNDRDRDGVPNAKDYFPDDPTKVAAIPSALSSLSSNLFAWYNAGDRRSVSTSNAGTVMAWYDFSGNDYHVYQNSLSNQPGYTAFQNTLPVISFTGSHFLSSASFGSVLPQAYTIVMMAKRTTLTSGTVLIDGISGSNRMTFSASSGQYALNAGSVVSGGLLQTVSEVVALVVNGGSSSIYVDGVLVAQSNSGSNSLSGLTFGADYLGANGFSGYLGEVTVFNKALSLSERKTVETYLGNKWLVTKTADRDGDGVRDYDDAFPTNALKSTANITIVAPTSYQNFPYTTSSVLVTVTMNIPESFNGYVAYTVNDRFLPQVFLGLGSTLNAKSVVTFNRTVVANSSYVLNVGLVTSRNVVLGTSEVRERRFMVDAFGAVVGIEPDGIAGLKLWLDAQDVSTVTLDSSNAVSQWRDKSGRGNHAAQAGASSLCPVYVLNGLNNKPAVVFDGVQDYLSVANESQFDGSDFTVFMVMTDTGSNANTTFLSKGNNVSGFEFSRAPLASKWVANISVFSPQILYGLKTMTAAHIYAFRYDSSTVSLHEDGDQAFSIVQGVPFSQNNLNVFIGALSGSSPSNYSKINVSEILIYSSALTPTQRQSIQNYLAGKWGISGANLSPYTVPLKIYAVDFGTTLTKTNLLDAVTRNIEIARQDVGTLILGTNGSSRSLGAIVGGKQSTRGALTLSGNNSLFVTYRDLVLGESGNSVLNLQAGTVSVNGVVLVASKNTSISTLNFTGGLLRTSAIKKGAGTAVFNWSGGILRTPLIATSVTNNGGVLDVRGTTQVNGNYAQLNGTLALDIFSASSAEKLSVTGKMTFGGTLNVTVSNNYSLKIGDSFDLLDFTTSSGSFSRLVLPALSAYVTWDVSLLPTTGVIKVINQPLNPLLDEDNDGVPNGVDQYPTWNYKVADFPSVLNALASSIALWTDSSTAAVSLDGTNHVLKWYDRSGKKRHFNLTSSGPLYVANSTNGKAGLRFSSAESSFLNGSGVVSSGYPLTVFMVVSANTEEGTLFSLEDKDVDTIYYSFGINSAGEFGLSVSNTTTKTQTTGRVAPAKPRVIRFELNSDTDKQLVVQGGKTAAMTTSIPLSGALDSFSLGRLGTASINPASYSQADMFELVVVTGSLTLAQKRSIESYLQTKWIGILDSDDDGCPDTKDAFIYDTKRTTCNVTIIAPTPNNLYVASTTSVMFQVTHNVGADFNGYLAYTVNSPFSQSTIVSKRTTVNVGTPATFVVPVQANNSYTVYVGLVDRSYNIITSCSVRDLTFSVSAPMPDFEPQMRITDGLQLWLDANDPLGNSTKPIDGTFLSVWKDKSGNGRHANALDFYRPTYVQGVLNGRPVIRFDGVNDEMVGALGPYKTIVGVLNVAAVPNTYGMVFGKYNDQDLSLRYSSTGLLTAPTTSDWHYGITSKVYMNGEQKSAVNRSLFHVVYSERNAADAFTYSLSSDFSNRRFQGDIAELLVYNKALSDTEREDVENYLATKWRIVSKNLELISVYSIDGFKTEMYSDLKNVVSKNLQVGADSQGTLILNSGGNFKNKNAILGGKKGAIGNAQLNHTNTYWLNDGDLIVGHYGQGSVVQNSGYVTVNLNLKIASNLNSTGSYTLAGGELKVGVLEKGKGASTWVWSGGVLRASVVSFNLTNTAGTFRVEAPTLVKGSYTQSDAGTLLVDIASAVSYKKLIVNGAFTMGGVLQIDFKNGYQGGAGDTFDILDFTTSSNAFSSLVLPALGTNLMWDTSKLYKTGVLSIQYAGPVDLDNDGVYDHLDAFPKNALRSTANISILSPVSGQEFSLGTTVVPVVVTLNVSSAFNGYLAYTVNSPFTLATIVSNRTTLNAVVGQRITVNVQTQNNSGYTVRFGLVNRPVTQLVTTTNIRTVVFSVNDISVKELVTKNNTQLVLWLDGADVNANGSVLSSGTVLTSWRDKSSYNNAADQDVTSKRPTFIVDGNGRKIVRFDGTNDNFFISNHTSLGLSNTFTIFIVDKATGSAKNPANYVLSKGINAYTVGVRDLATSFSLDKLGSSSAFNVAVSNNGLLQFNIKTLVQSPTLTHVALNGSRLTPAVTTTTFSNSLDGLAIASNTAQNGNYFDGDIAEILIFNYVVPTAHRELIQTYLSSKWVISAKDLLPQIGDTDYVVDNQEIRTLTGSLQISTRDIRLGKNSVGTLVGNNAATILSRSALLGSVTNSSGEAVMNTGSKWVALTNFLVGGFGQGVVTQNGGVVSINIGLLLAKESGSVGRYVLQSGTLNVKEISKGLGSASFVMSGGLLRSEKVNMPFVNSGGVLDPNPLSTFTNSFTQTSGETRIGIRSATNYDKVAVSGQFNMGGTLRIAFENGYFPVVNTSYDILDFSTSANAFSQIILPVLNDFVTWNMSSLYKTGVISVSPFDSDKDGVLDSFDAYPFLASRSTANIVITTPNLDVEYVAGKSQVQLGVDVTYAPRFSGYIAYTKNAPFTKANIISTGVSVNVARHVTFNISTQDDSGYVILVGLINPQGNPVTTTNVVRSAFSVLSAGDVADPTAYVIDDGVVETKTALFDLSTRNIRIGYVDKGTLTLGTAADFRGKGALLGGRKNTSATLNITSQTSQWLANGDVVVGKSGKGVVVQDKGVVSLNASLTLAAMSGSSGAYYLKGGELRVATLNAGSGTSVFSWTGGIFSPTNIEIPITQTAGTLDVKSKTKVSATYTLQNNAVIQFGIRSATKYDRFVSTGLIKFGGKLAVAFENGYFPTLGLTFDLFDFVSSQNAFTTISLPPLNDSLSWDTSKLYKTGVIKVISLDSDGDGVIDKFDAYPTNALKTAATVTFTAPVANSQFEPNVTTVSVGLDCVVPQVFSGYVAYTINADMTSGAVIALRSTRDVASHVTINIPVVPNTTYTILATLVRTDTYAPIPTVSVSTRVFSIKRKTADFLLSAANTGLAFRLDASDMFGNGTSPASGTVVTSWKDKSRYGVLAAQSVSTKKPTYILENSVPRIRFDGVNDTLVISNHSGLNLANSMTFFYVAKGMGSAKQYTNYMLNKGLAYGIAFEDLARTISLDAPNTGSVAKLSQSVAGRSHIGTLVKSGTTVKMAVDGTYLDPILTNRTLVNNVSSLIIGGNDSQSASFYDGDIMEIVGFNSALSTEDRQAIQNYLSTKWLISGIDLQPEVLSDTDYVVEGGTTQYRTTSLTIPTRNLIVGRVGSGTLTLSGTSVLTAKQMVLGALANTVGKVNVDNSSASLVSLGTVVVGDAGIGIVSQNAGLVSANTYFKLSGSAGSVGNYYLKGGVLSLDTLMKGNGSGTLLMQGGILRAKSILYSFENTAGVLDVLKTTTISGGYSQGASATTTIELRSATDFDKLVVNGSLDASGTLAITLKSGYVPANGTTFDVLDFTSSTNVFTSFSLPPLVMTSRWDLSEFSTTGKIKVVYTPNIDWDNDGVRDSWDAYPSNNARSSGDITVISPSNYTLLSLGSTTAQIRMNHQTASSFNVLPGKIAYTLNAPFTKSVIDGGLGAESQSLSLVNTINVALTNGTLYVVRIGFVSPNNTPVAAGVAKTWYISVPDETVDATAYKVENGTSTLTTSLSVSTRNLEIGQYFIGALTISGTGGLRNKAAILGGVSNAAGTLNMTSSGLWSSEGSLTIGRKGWGAVVQNSGTVSTNASIILAEQAGSTGRYSLTGGTLSAKQLLKGSGTGVFTWTGGTLKINTSNITLTNSGGTLDVQPFKTVINGGYTQTSGTLAFEIRSTKNYDKLIVNGTLSMADTLQITFNGYTPKYEDTFDLFDFVSTSNKFSTLQLPTLPLSFVWDTSNLYKTGVVRIALSSTTDSDGDLVSDYNDAYPLDPLKSTSNLTVNLPASNAYFSYTQRMVTLNVGYVVPLSFRGTLAYTLNESFETGTRTVCDISNRVTPLIKTISVTGNRTYVIRVGLVNANNTVVTTASIRTLTFYTDGDFDGDGVGDKNDAFPADPTKTTLAVGQSATDTDGDGVPNIGDSFPTDSAAAIDTDGDGYPNVFFKGYSVLNNGKSLDRFPSDGLDWYDDDNDGVANNLDTYPADPLRSTANITLITPLNNDALETGTSLTCASISMKYPARFSGKLGWTINQAFTSANIRLANTSKNVVAYPGVVTFNIPVEDGGVYTLRAGLIGTNGSMFPFTTTQSVVFRVSDSDFVVEGGQVMSLTTPLAMATRNIVLGRTGDGSILLNSGAELSTLKLSVGKKAGASGYVRVNAGVLRANYLIVADSGLGSVTQNAGVVSINSTLILGNLSTGVGKYVLAGGTLWVPRIEKGVGSAQFLLNAGYLTTQYIGFSLTNTGATLNISKTTTVNGSFAQQASGTMVFTIRSDSDYSKLVVKSALTLGGRMHVVFDGYTPSKSQVFKLIDSVGTSNAFAQMVLPSLPGSFAWDTSKLTSKGELIITRNYRFDTDADGVVDGFDAYPSDARRSTSNIRVLSPQNRAGFASSVSSFVLKVSSVVPYWFNGSIAYSVNSDFTITANRTVVSFSPTRDISVTMPGLETIVMVGLVSPNGKLVSGVTPIRHVVYKTGTLFKQYGVLDGFTESYAAPTNIDFTTEFGMLSDLDGIVGKAYPATLNLVSGVRVTMDSFLMSVGAVPSKVLVDTAKVNLFTDMIVGQSGAARLVIQDGLMNVGGALVLALGSSASSNVDLNGGTLRVDTLRKGLGRSVFNWTGGVFSARYVDMNLKNTSKGVFEVSRPVTINGTYQQAGNATLNIKISNASLYGSFAVTGVFQKGGDLKISFVNEWLPNAPATFNILKAPNTSGAFNRIVLPALPFGYIWNTSRLDSQGILGLKVFLPQGDNDGDGMPNSRDQYPEDSTKVVDVAKELISATPNMILWLDSTYSLSLVTDNSKVSMWYDLSSKRNNVVQSVSNAKPAYGMSKISSANSVSFAANQQLQTQSSVSFNNYTAIVVFKDTDTKESFEPVLSHDPATGFWIGRQLSTGGSWGGGFRNGNLASGNYFVMPDGAVIAMMLRKNGAVLDTFANGKKVSSRVVEDVSSGYKKITLGKRDGSSFTGEIGEVMVLNRALTDSEIASYNRYLSAKWSPKPYFQSAGIVDGESIKVNKEYDLRSDLVPDLYVGFETTGRLDIDNGYRVLNRKTILGSESLASGNIRIEGAQTRWYSEQGIIVGKSGKGRIEQFDGVVTVTGNVVLAELPNSRGGYLLSGGTLNVYGELKTGLGFGSFEWTGGTLKFDAVTFNVQNTGTGILSPGHSPAYVVMGAYTAGPSSTIEMEIGGTSIKSPSEYDHIQFNGFVTLNGTLRVVTINGYHFEADTSFDLFDYLVGVTASFNSIILPELPSELRWVTRNLYTTGVISVVYAVIDSDGDGVLDNLDAFPYDATLSAVPSSNSLGVLPVTSGLVLRLDGHKPHGDAFVTGNTRIQTWLDYSGQGFHGSQDTVPSRLLYATSNVFSGFKTIKNDGSRYFNLPDASVLASHNMFTVFVVGAKTSLVGNDYLIAFGNNELNIGTSGNAVFLYQVDNIPQYVRQARLDVGKPYLFSFVQDTVAATTTAKTFIQGIQDPVSMTFTTAIAPISGLQRRLFKNASGNYWDGEVAEILMYNRALTDVERIRVENYLDQKWKLKITRYNPFMFGVF